MLEFIKTILFSFIVVGYSGLTFASETIYYTAKISNNDRYNSHGDRLRTVAVILRQDRANVYKFGQDNYYNNGFIPTVKELFAKILTGK